MNFTRMFRSLGPAIIVASVVLGPGSLLTSSRVGVEYGYQMLWVLASAVVLMIGMTTLGALLGVTCRQTPCEEVARIAGRPWAVAIGITIFLIIVCFQSSNNLAVLSSLEVFTEPIVGETAELDAVASRWSGVLALVLLNTIVAAAMYGMKHLYRPVERMMMVLVLIMLAGFSANLWFARPDFGEVLRGLVPRLPEGMEGRFFPWQEGETIVDPWWALQGLIATTLSVAGAFYQCYLVREKGWSLSNVRQSVVDSACGIAVLGAVSAIVMITSASALKGILTPDDLNTASDVARQLEPLFGASATLLFSLGIFAAAFSSFLGNALIGGTVLSDGLGLGSSMDGAWPKRLTVLTLAVSMGFAIGVTAMGYSLVPLIIFAQALSVLGVPVLAALMVFLAHRARQEADSPIAGWVIGLGWIAMVLTTLLALRTAWRIYLQVF